MIDLLTRVDVDLATQVAARLGYRLSDEAQKTTPPPPVNSITRDPTLSLYATGPRPLKGRQVARFWSATGLKPPMCWPRCRR